MSESPRAGFHGLGLSHGYGSVLIPYSATECSSLFGHRVQLPLFFTSQLVSTTSLSVPHRSFLKTQDRDKGTRRPSHNSHQFATNISSFRHHQRPLEKTLTSRPNEKVHIHDRHKSGRHHGSTRSSVLLFRKHGGCKVFPRRYRFAYNTRH